MQRRSRIGGWLTLALALGGSAACGGGSLVPGSSGGAPNAGGVGTGAAAGTGGGASGGSASGGGASSSGGAPGGSGGASGGLGGAMGGSGQVGTGGSGVGGTSGSGGLPGICSCEAAELPVCGVDGQTYNAGCSELCVPVDIACPGECPCEPDAGCGCVPSTSPLCSEGLLWECSGQDFDPSAPVDLGCEDTGTALIRYCCPLTASAEEFCAP